jgi:hypothetical protein
MSRAEGKPFAQAQSLLRAEQSTAPDRLQPPLLRRFGFRRQVSASVRGWRPGKTPGGRRAWSSRRVRDGTRCGGTRAVASTQTLGPPERAESPERSQRQTRRGLGPCASALRARVTQASSPWSTSWRRQGLPCAGLPLPRVGRACCREARHPRQACHPPCGTPQWAHPPSSCRGAGGGAVVGAMLVT